MKKVLFWFRNDLRLHDHEWISEIASKADVFLPVYCFNPDDFGMSVFGFERVGMHRKKFILENVWALKRKLQEKGSDLYIAWGRPEEVIPELAIKFSPDVIGFEKEFAWEEQQVEIRLVNNINNRWFVKTYYGKSLMHPLDLPFSITKLPFQFTEFRKQVESNWVIRKTYSEPVHLPFWPKEIEHKSGLHVLPVSILQALETLLTPYSFAGGEDAALIRLQHYFWGTQQLAKYKETRNELLGTEYSSRLSPWLSIGSLSSRRVYEEVKRFEKDITANESTYWLIFELLWRDFFRWVTWKFGKRIFYLTGITQRIRNWVGTFEDFERWKNGETGVPLVDACMTELKQTGYLSNRGRQLAASFLVNDLRCDWRWGASWFEHCLVDYDVCSNWGNWMYIAGVGNDSRKDRYFKIEKQAAQYDAQGLYVKTWLTNKSYHALDRY
ncbi:MAG: DASH family cryptochrome [Flavobacteriales bacterium]|nr:DASH family cryptochrome [Flavobacteriales bacterium]